jgi:hypothetical protein
VDAFYGIGELYIGPRKNQMAGKLKFPQKKSEFEVQRRDVRFIKNYGE